MKKLLYFSFLVVLIYACGQSASSPSVKPVSMVSGVKIYKQYCVTCHGVDGKMMMNGAKDLTASELNKEERIHVITNGRNTMAAYKSLLSEKEIAAVAVYTLKLKEKND